MATMLICASLSSLAHDTGLCDVIPQLANQQDRVVLTGGSVPRARLGGKQMSRTVFVMVAGLVSLSKATSLANSTGLWYLGWRNICCTGISCSESILECL